MRIVLFSRVPSWYSFRGDRLVTRLAQEGHDVVGVVVERTPTLTMLREWLWKLGPELVLEKGLRKAARLLGWSRGRPEQPGQTAARPAVNPPVFVVQSHNSSAAVETV